MRERERDNEIREMDSARFQQWSKQEETFHLEQARLRSKIRIKVKLRMIIIVCENYLHFNIQDGRAKPIDFLARYLDVLQGKDAPDTDLHEPYIYMNGLDKTELEDLQADINVSKKCEHLESITSGLSEYSRAQSLTSRYHFVLAHKVQLITALKDGLRVSRSTIPSGYK